MTHAKLTKIDTANVNPDGIDDGYTITGFYVRRPTAGERFEVIRYDRNGVKLLGVFSTSPVVAVGKSLMRGIKQFKTQNSTYLLQTLRKPKKPIETGIKFVSC